MHRIDNSKFLLFIEPKKEEKALVPLNDNITAVMEHALERAEKGTANYYRIGEKERFNPNGGWKGCHGTDCGERSENCEYLLENGMITNSLAVFYLQYYRNSIPKSEMDKVMQVVKIYE